MGNFSPVALAATMPVSRTLLFFPPEHFSLDKRYVLVGRHGSNRPNSSVLNRFSYLDFDSKVDSNVLFHGEIISFVIFYGFKTDIISKK